MRVFNLLIFCSIFIIAINSCSSKKKSTVTNYEFATECLGTEMDGSLTLKAWGKGRNYFDASEQAKKQAVRDVIFKGIHKGLGGCNKDPILLEPNAQSRNEEYFYTFFADKGEYSKFVSTRDEKIKNKISRDKKKQSESVSRMVVVIVDRYGLKQKLIQDGIIN